MTEWASRSLGVIPARGGSKGVPRKNIAEAGGRALIEYTIEAARASSLSRVVVSTDDEEIAQKARDAGADVPFLRPAELATDEAGSVEVGSHALAHCESDERRAYDILVLLQPTVPLRTAADIDATVQLLLDNGDRNTAIAVAEAGEHPNYFYTKQGSRFVFNGDKHALGRPRQSFPTYYIRTGAVYAVRVPFFKSQATFMEEACLGHVVPRERSINVDSPFELLLVDLLLRQRKRMSAR